ncbi:hypothetical protein [Mycolicibacterium sp. CBMA 361]|uniref:hypothetical protein n=1 Tax=Mycolicibacterium sp. CBMA 361 TaxID=2606610 RepID=UPI0012DEFCF5|nr:hypothetical protein [Mycolicibacterium sp. CBMA 361]MUM35070.1 hypothetical protein [Mycolicibacterium sp. CBMA 361]
MAGLVTTGSLDGAGADVLAEAVGLAVPVPVADVGAVDDADAEVELAGDDADVEVLDAVGDSELDVSVVDEPADGDVVVVPEVGDVVDDSVPDGVVVSEADVVVVDVEDDGDTTTGTGNSVSGDDGMTGNGSPAGGSVAAGFCSTTL